MPEMKNVVIGAGLCGLMIARGLRALGESVAVIEKAKGVGGRLATRRTSTARFDHGAQFYTRQSPLEKMHLKWQQASLVQPWFESSGKGYFTAKAGMTSLAKDLASDLDVKLETRIASLKFIGGGWQLTCESGSEFASERVILTAPLPQALELLRESKIEYDSQLESVTYAKAIVVLIELNSNFEVDPSFDSGITDRSAGYFELPSSSFIFSIVDQKIKGISASPALTVTLKSDASREMYEDSDEAVIARVSKELTRVSAGLDVLSLQVKRWRFAQPIANSQSALGLIADLGRGLYLAGDAFGGPSLNGAARSANALIELLTS